jgi:hypothetical protein
MEQLPFEVLLKAFEAATSKADDDVQMPTIRKLELFGVPPLRHPLLIGGSHFQCLRVVESLVLHFHDWFCEIMDDDEMTEFSSSPDLHGFVSNLGDWLSIGQDIRKKLVLSFDNYTGHFPKLCLNAIYYPWLSVLELTGVTPFHDTQVTWIAFHGQTLRSLRLTECPIVTKVVTYMVVDEQCYPIPAHTSVANSLFWYHVLGRFTAELCKLREFQIEFLEPRQGYLLGMTSERYRFYKSGYVNATEDSDQVHEEYLSKDTAAYLELL